MNALLASVFDLPTRQRVLLLVGTVFFLFLVYAYFLYWPRADRIAQQQARVEELTKNRDLKASLASNLESARAMIADLNAAFKQATVQLPDTKEIPDLLSNISTVGRESGLDVIQFRQRAEQPIDFYAEVPVEVLVRGAFRQIATFFDRVSRLTRIVNVSDISIRSPSRIDNDPVILDTACTVTTFRFLDEAERERIAKEREKKGKP